MCKCLGWSGIHAEGKLASGLREKQEMECKKVGQFFVELFPADGLQNTAPQDASECVKTAGSVLSKDGKCWIKGSYTGSCVTGVLRTFNVQNTQCEFLGESYRKQSFPNFFCLVFP